MLNFQKRFFSYFIRVKLEVLLPALPEYCYLDSCESLRLGGQYIALCFLIVQAVKANGHFFGSAVFTLFGPIPTNVGCCIYGL